MKNWTVLILGVLATYSLWAQNPIKDSPMIKGSNAIDGHTIMPIVVTLPYQDYVTLEIPDTLWIKRAKKPKEGKNYTLNYSYTEPFIGEKFYVKYLSGNYYLGTSKLCLKSLNSGKTIIVDLEDYERLKEVAVCDVAEALTDRYSGKTIYIPKTDEEYPSIDSYYPVIIDDVAYRYGYGGRFRQIANEIIVNARDSNGKLITISNHNNIGNNMLSEEEYLAKYEENTIRKLNAGSYSFELSNVTSSIKSIGKGRINPIQGNQSFLYEDNLISLNIEKTHTMFEFTLKNKSNSVLKVKWDDAVFVDVSNRSQRVVHRGIRYIDSSKPQAPTNIAPGSELKDLLIPAENMKFSSVNGEWYNEDIIPRNSTVGKYPKGTTVKIILPIEMGSTKIEYTLQYDVIWIYSYPEFREQYLKEHPPVLM